MAFKKMHTVVAVVGIVGASALAWWLQSPKSDTSGTVGARPVGVEVAQVKKMALRDDAEAVGTLRSAQNVMLRPEVAGRVLALGFADGARVRAGQVLKCNSHWLKWRLPRPTTNAIKSWWLKTLCLSARSMKAAPRYKWPMRSWACHAPV